MERFIQSIIDAVLGLQGTVAYVAVGLLAFGEAAAFLGLVTPGEISMVLGGVLASQGRVSLVILSVVASIAAILGDSVGYWIGRRFGRRMLEWEPLGKRARGPVDRAEEYFAERGGRAVIVGRWASVVRTFVPFVAGLARMSYPRFLVYSIPSATVWAVSFILLGFAAGQSWHLVERYSGPASLIVLLLVGLALLLRWGARKVAENQERVRAAGDRLAATRPVRWLRTNFGDQIRWLMRRFDPHVARGLGLTLGFVLLIVSGVGVGIVINDLRAFEGLALVDVPVRQFMTDVRTEAAIAVAEVVNSTFEWPWAVLPTAAVAAFAGWRLQASTSLRVFGGGLGAAGIAYGTQLIVVERIPGTEFPSVPVAVATALLIHASSVAGARYEWATAVKLMAGGLFLLALVGLSGLLTARAAVSGIVLAAAVGATWASALEVLARLPFRLAPADTADASSMWPFEPPVR